MLSSLSQVRSTGCVGCSSSSRSAIRVVRPAHNPSHRHSSAAATTHLHSMGRSSRQTAAHVCRAKKQDPDNADMAKGALMTAVGYGSQLVDSLSSWVPETVPRPAAKVGVAFIAGTVLITLAQQLVSGVLTLAVVGGLGYFFIFKGGKLGADEDDDEDEGSGGGKKASKRSDNMDDPLADARAIMDKYK